LESGTTVPESTVAATPFTESMHPSEPEVLPEQATVVLSQPVESYPVEPSESTPSPVYQTPQQPEPVLSEPVALVPEPQSSPERLSPSDPNLDLQEDAPPTEGDVCGIRIYTDTTEGVPEVETDVQETEEVLPDGTVVRRKVSK